MGGVLRQARIGCHGDPAANSVSGNEAKSGPPIPSWRLGWTALGETI
jgi:hypothetical protein